MAKETVAIQKVRGDRWGILARIDRSHAYEVVQVLQADRSEDCARSWALWWEDAIADRGLEAARDTFPRELARIQSLEAGHEPTAGDAMAAYFADPEFGERRRLAAARNYACPRCGSTVAHCADRECPPEGAE